MTRAYLLSTLSSSSSIGGVVMPSGLAAVPATPYLTSSGRTERRGKVQLRLPASTRRRREHEAREGLGSCFHRRVHDDLVELVLGRELDGRGVEPALDHLGVLGAPPSQPPLELL